MSESSKSARHGRAVRGLDAAAAVLHQGVESYAVAGGEGARRLADALEALGAGGPTRLPGAGLEAARGAVGASAAGKRVALLVSGDGVTEALPALREMDRLGLPVLLVIPSHGPDVGEALPAAGVSDLRILLGMHVGVLLAADATQVAAFTLAAQRAAMDRGAPWAVAFELTTVGLVLASAVLPDAETVRAWSTSRTAHASDTTTSLDAVQYDLEKWRVEHDRFGFAVGAALREVERAARQALAPVMFEGARDADLVVIATGSAARSARSALAHLAGEGFKHAAVVQVASLRPFPAADVVRLAWRARTVIVHEPLPDPLGTGGALSDAVRASFADALTWHPGFAGIGRIPTVVTLLGRQVASEDWLHAAREAGGQGDPPRLLLAGPAGSHANVAETRLELALGDAERAQALHVITDWLAHRGVSVLAHANEPTRATLSLSRPATGARAPSQVLLAAVGGVFDPSRLEGLPSGALVVLAGDFPDRVLAETMRAAAPKGIRVASLHASSGALHPLAAVAATVQMLVGDGTLAEDPAWEQTLREHAIADAGAVQAQAQQFTESLRAQFR